MIGTALVNLLLKEGAQILVGDLKPCPPEWAGKLIYRLGDLNELAWEELEEFQPQTAFHLAATFERSEETLPFFEENFRHNIQLSHHLLRCFARVPAIKKIVFASSYLIYDPALYLFPKEPNEVAILSEQSPIGPRNLCGFAKLLHEGELHCMQHLLPEKRSITSARIFRAYGKNSRDIVSRWIRTALREETVQLYRPEGRFDYIFSEDVAEGLLRLAKSPFSGIVNLGTGRARSVREVIHIIQSHFPDLKVEPHASDIPYEASQADMNLFKEITAWTPPHTLERAIPLMIAYEKSKPLPWR